MTHVPIAECLGEDFLAQALHREYRHVPGALDVVGLMTWDDLNQILASHRLQPPRMRLSRAGETLLVGGYTTPVATRRHTVWHRLHPAELHARLKEGASLALDSIDELHPPLGRLCEAIERELRTRVQVNLYASWSATEGFGVHWDDHDTVVVQLDGAKRWRIYGTTRPFLLYRDIEDPGEAPTEPVADLVLWPGDVLYVPRGVWPAVSADQGTRSLHVTCGLQTGPTMMSRRWAGFGGGRWSPPACRTASRGNGASASRANGSKRVRAVPVSNDVTVMEISSSSGTGSECQESVRPSPVAARAPRHTDGGIGSHAGPRVRGTLPRRAQGTPARVGGTFPLLSPRPVPSANT
ncbi:JmjC domain-containing protein [Streptomyces sp. LN245]|uniref:JmjC domain-containing protein n=1 Tax=Streptomyces sp. LN245 TaxID=3112975 RepID=UPI003719AA13